METGGGKRVVGHPTPRSRRLDEGSSVRRFKYLALLAGVLAVVAVTAGPAFGAASITSPNSNPFTVPNAADNTTPAQFPVTVTGFTASIDTIDLMVCDPTDPATDQTWTAAAHCDFGTDVGKTANASGGASFTAAQSVPMFRGASPSNSFACNAAGDPQVSGIQNYTNCRLVAMNAVGDIHPSLVTSITLTLSPPGGLVPEVPYAVILPVGALLVGGAFLVIRKRRAQQLAA
jgi:hypothetical protein